MEMQDLDDNRRNRLCTRVEETGKKSKKWEKNETKRGITSERDRWVYRQVENKEVW